MKQILITLALLSGFAFAQQQATLSGIIKTDNETTPETRVAIHVVDRDGLPQVEVSSTTLIANTFSLGTASVGPEYLSTLRNGSILLPGLQNEYTISPQEGVNFAKGQVTVYVDSNDNQVMDFLVDATYLGIASLEEPIGFFNLIYVDGDVTFSGSGVDLGFKAGWNIYTVRYLDNGESLYEVQAVVDDTVMDVFLP